MIGNIPLVSNTPYMGTSVNDQVATAGYDSFPNEAKSNQWRCTISNIPDYDGDMQIFDNMVKEFTTPSISSNEHFIKFAGTFSQDMMEPNRNGDGYEVEINMAVCDGYENVAYILNWWNNVEYGLYPDGTILHEKKIHHVYFHLLDAKGNVRLSIAFRDLSLMSLTGLAFTSGEASTLSTTLTLKAVFFCFSFFDRDGNLIFSNEEQGQINGL